MWGWEIGFNGTVFKGVFKALLWVKKRKKNDGIMVRKDEHGNGAANIQIKG